MDELMEPIEEVPLKERVKGYWMMKVVSRWD